MPALSSTPPTLYRRRVARSATNLGFRGAQASIELVEVDEPLRVLIHDGSGEHKLEATLANAPSASARTACKRVLAGDTSLKRYCGWRERSREKGKDKR